MQLYSNSILVKWFVYTRTRSFLLYSSHAASEQGGLALAEVIFGDVNPSGTTKPFTFNPGRQLIASLPFLLGKMPVSAPRDVGTAPAFYNWLKASRPTWPGAGKVLDNGTLIFDHYVSISAVIG